ncbi:unnamed protein product, partial [Nesidiocoris tenuis]
MGNQGVRAKTARTGDRMLKKKDFQHRGTIPVRARTPAGRNPFRNILRKILVRRNNFFL